MKTKRKPKHEIVAWAVFCEWWSFPTRCWRRDRAVFTTRRDARQAKAQMKSDDGVFYRNIRGPVPLVEREQ